MRLDGLRIALVGPLPPPVGGMAVLTEQLAGLLRSDGARVELVQINAPYRPAWAARLKGVRALFRLLPYLHGLWRACGRADLVHVMANSGWSWHLFARPALRVAALRGVPVVVNYHGGEAEDFLAQAASSVRRSLCSTRALLVPSGFLVDVFARHGIAARILPNVIDLSRFVPRPKAASSRSGPHLVVARNLEHIYGADLAIRAFVEIRQRYPGARLSLTGTGPAQSALESLAGQLGVAEGVRFLGRLDRDAMVALYQGADLLLNPSRADNLPGAILEAMASGVPIIASAVGGVPYLLEHDRTALLVPAEDPAALADAALALLDAPERGAALTKTALAEVQRYDWKHVRPVLLNEYALALGHAPAHATG